MLTAAHTMADSLRLRRRTPHGLAVAGLLALGLVLGFAGGLNAAPKPTAHTQAPPPPPPAPTPPSNRFDLEGWLQYQRTMGAPSLPAAAQLFHRRGTETLRSGASEDGVRMLRGATQLDPTFLAPRLALLSHFSTRDPSQALMELARIVDLARTHFPLQHFLMLSLGFHATLTVFLATLCAALFVIARRREAIRHTYEEVCRSFLSERMSVAVAWCLLLLPFLAGIGIAVPALFTMGMLWPALRRTERAIFALLAVLLIGMPIAGEQVARVAAPDTPGRAPFYGALDLEHSPFDAARLAELRRRSAEDPDNGFLHFATAWMAGRGGDRELARAEYAEAQRILPNEPRIPNNLGNIAESEGVLEEAENRYREAVTMAPGWAMPHYNLGQLYTKQFRYAEASEELARATSYDFELVRELQARAQMHPGNAAPVAWGWLSPETLWDETWAYAAIAPGAAVPPRWAQWIELRGRHMAVLAVLLGIAGLAIGMLIRHKLPVRACSNCEYAVCRRCASRRRDRAYCTSCTAALREATTPEFSRLLLLRRRRGLTRKRHRIGIALSILLPGYGAALVDRIGLAWGLLLIGCAGAAGLVGSAAPYRYDRSVGPLSGISLDTNSMLAIAIAGALSVLLYLAFRSQADRSEEEAEFVKRPATRLPRAA